MSSLSGMLKILTSPIRGATEIYDDLTGENGEAEQGLSILSLGTTSVLKGVAKGLKEGLDDL